MQENFSIGLPNGDKQYKPLVERIAVDTSEQEPDRPSFQERYHYLTSWLINHIQGSDKK